MIDVSYNLQRQVPLLHNCYQKLYGLTPPEGRRLPADPELGWGDRGFDQLS